MASFKDSDPRSLEPSLNSAIDPDSLDALFTASRGRSPSGSVTFSYSGCRVTVDDSGDVLVREDESIAPQNDPAL